MTAFFASQNLVVILQYVALYVFGRGLILYTAFYALHQVVPKRMLISTEKVGKGQIKSEIIHCGIANLIDTVVLTAVLASGIVRETPFNIPSLLLSFLFCFIFFEFWFYGVHRLIHLPRFRWIHKQHHLSRVTTAFSSSSLSSVEKLFNVTGLFVIPCLLTQAFPLVLEGIVAYHAYNFFVNVLGHSNIEFIKSPGDRPIVAKVLSSSSYHSLHHSKGVGNYGLFTCIPDRLFHTMDLKIRGYQE